MIGLILIAVSWLLLRAEGKSLSVLGFNKPFQRGIEFAIGFFIAALFASTQFLLKSHLADFDRKESPCQVCSPSWLIWYCRWRYRR